MACVTKRRGKWVVDIRIQGRRVVKQCRTRCEADEALGKLTSEQKQRTTPAVDPFIKLKDYARRWLADCEDAEAVPSTLHCYRQCLKNHITPVLGDKRIRNITKADVRTLLSAKAQDGAARNTVQQIKSVLSGVLTLAVEDEIISHNPAHGAIRQRRTKAARMQRRVRASRTIKAMSRDQRNAFLLAAKRDRETHPAFMLMALAGLRLNECLGLQWDAVDLNAMKLHVHRQLIADSTKSGNERTVDMAESLVAVLRVLLATRRAKSFSRGEVMSPWVIYPWLPAQPERKDKQNVEKQIRRAMTRALKTAELPQHFTPHSLRHTFCSLLIASGVSPVYVQQQAGHSSVEMTVSVYGSWFAVEAPGAMDRLAEGLSGNNSEESGNKMAAGGAPDLMPTGTYSEGGSCRSSSTP